MKRKKGLYPMGGSTRRLAIYRNVNKLRDLLADGPSKGGQVGVLVDCESGEFNIPQAIGDLEAFMHQSKKREDSFKYLELKIVHADTGVFFEWVGPEWQSGLSRASIDLLQETMSVLNHCGKLFRTKNDQEILLECMRLLKGDVPEEIKEHSAWFGDLERIPAEKCLCKKAPGTYLLRKGDGCTRMIEGNLASQDSGAVRCFVVTIVENSSKVSDKILIQRPNGWAVYNDEPTLFDYRFKTLAEAIASAGGTKPLRHSDAA